MPLLLFIPLVLVLIIVLGGLAAGDPNGVVEPEAAGSEGAAASGPQTQSFEVSAADLGGFGGSPPAIKSPSAMVVAMESGKVLYERKAQTRRAMASTTKMMTAILILESGVDLDTEVEVSAKAANTWEPSKWVRAGDVLTVDQLLYALMLRSANGAAVALAQNDAGGVSAFVEKMNRKADELGMKDTSFVTTNGLDSPGHYSTAADLAVLARYAMRNDTFREIVNTEKYTLSIEGEEPLALTNTNKLLLTYDWVIGVKTGSTPNADHCLVSAATKDGREVIAVVLGAADSDLCFAESKKLLQYGLDEFRQLTLIEKGVPVAEVDVPHQTQGKLRLVTDGALSTELYEDDVVKTTVVIERPLELPIEAGETYGRVVVTSGEKEIGRVALVADRSFSGPTLGSKFVYYLHRLGAALGMG